MTQSVIQRAFSGGELTPALGARADNVKYLSGLKTCRNFLVQRHGGVTKRPGTRFVAAVKDAAVSPRLIPFIFEAADQTYAIEAGDGYFRFFWHGAPVVVTGVGAYAGGTTYALADLVVSGGVNYYSKQAGNVGHTPASSPTYWYPLTADLYEVPTPYAGADVSALRATQSIDILTITHPSYPIYELQRAGQTTWKLIAVSLAPSLAAPTSLSATAGTAGALTLKYKVSASKANTFEESLASAEFVLGSAAMPTPDAPNPLTWTDPNSPAAAEYYVYLDPFGNGIFGYIGTATGVSFNDVGFAPDFTVTPPIARVLFDATNKYPRVAAYYQQRLVFGGSNTDRETVWASKIGAYKNFSISTPLQDDDAVTFVIAGNHLNPVAHLVSLKQLLVLSDAGLFIVRGDQNGVLTPTGINADQEGYLGVSAAVVPVVVGNTLLYVQARGTVLRDLSFQQTVNGFIGQDLTIFATHLFEGYTIRDLAFAETPHSIVWAVRSDGTLLGLTYLKEQDVWGWHRHDTGAAGQFEAVLVLPDTPHGEDVTYVVVKRTIGGVTKRYIERLATLQVSSVADAFFVDAGLSYTGAPATHFSGLSHLEGQVVAVLGDGEEIYNGDPAGGDASAFTVTSGAITIPAAKSTVQIGLPIRFPDVELLDLDVQGTGIRDKKKRPQELSLLVQATRHAGLFAGPDVDHLIEERPERWQAASDRVTGQLDITLTAGFDPSGRIFVRHTSPLPCTILGVIPNLEMGAY